MPRKNISSKSNQEPSTLSTLGIIAFFSLMFSAMMGGEASVVAGFLFIGLGFVGFSYCVIRFTIPEIYQKLKNDYKKGDWRK